MMDVSWQFVIKVMIDFRGEHGEYSVANAIWALMYSAVMTPAIWWTKNLDYILTNGDTLYQQTGKCE